MLVCPKHGALSRAAVIVPPPLPAVIDNENDAVDPGVVSVRVMGVPVTGTGVGDTTIVFVTGAAHELEAPEQDVVPYRKALHTDVLGFLHGPEPEEQPVQSDTDGGAPMYTSHARVPYGQDVVPVEYGEQ